MKTIHIAGGGLAGLALGILLRREGVPVTITEAASYPRHRVCGEFISGRGVEIAKDLGGSELLARGKAREARTVSFFTANRRLGRRTLPAPGLSVSRFELDALLARKFQESGGELVQHTRIPEADRQQGFILAIGRRRETAPPDGCRWFGLKAHFSHVELETDLEMHVHRDAYVGLCRLPGNMVNVCGLFRRRAGSSPQHESPLAVLRGARGTALHCRLENGNVDSASLSAVAGLSLRRFAKEEGALRIGDAWSMIPPITGNGMSMAFESALLATNAVTEYARGIAEWNQVTRTVASRLDARFRGRLRTAAAVQAFLFQAARQPLLAAVLFRTGWRAGFDLTR